MNELSVGMIVGYLCACAAIGGWVGFCLTHLWAWAQRAKLRAIARDGAVRRGVITFTDPDAKLTLHDGMEVCISSDDGTPPTLRESGQPWRHQPGSTGALEDLQARMAERGNGAGFDPRRQAQDVLTPEAYDRLAKERGWL
jgi:hypothetical protein